MNENIEAYLANQEQSISSSFFFVREDAFAQLVEAAQQSFEGRGRVVVIKGEAGIGKSVLIKQLFNQLRSYEFEFYHHTFNRQTSCSSHQSFTESLFTCPDNQTDNLKMFNDLQSQLGEIEKMSEGSLFNWKALDEQKYHHHLVGQKTLERLIRKSKRKAQFICWENTHLAPLMFWKFLHYLAGNVSDRPLFIVITLTENRPITKERSQDASYRDILQRMNREGVIRKITLKRFGQHELRQMLNHFFKKTDFSSDFIPVLYKLSGGHPFRVMTYLKLMYQQQLLFKQQDVWFNRSPVDEHHLVTSASELSDYNTVVQRLRELSDIQKEILYYASIMEEGIAHGVLSQVLQKDRFDIVKELQNLSEKAFIFQDENGEFCFKTNELQAIVARQIHEDKKKNMYMDIAAVLERDDSIDRDAKIYRLAEYYEKSAQTKWAHRYITRAATIAIRKLAFSEARHFMQKLFYIKTEDLSEMEKMLTVQMYIQAAWLERTMGDNEQSLLYCEKAQQLYDEEDLDKINLLIRIQKSFAYFNLNQWDRARENLEVCSKAEHLLGDFERTHVYYGMGKINLELGKYDEAGRYLNRALADALSIESSTMIAMIYNSLGVLATVHNDPMQSIAYYSKAIPIYKKQGDKIGLARIYNNIGLTYANIHDWEKANEFYGKSLGISDIMGLLQLKGITFVNRALALVHLNRLDEAQEYAFKAYRLAKLLKDELGLAEYYKIRGIIEVHNNQCHQAVPFFNEALNRFIQLKNRLGIAETQYALAEMEIGRHCHRAALARLRKALQTYRSIGVKNKIKRIQNKIAELQDGEITADKMNINNKMLSEV